MNTHIDCLFELCKQQPFDIEEIEKYISENKLNSEEVTRAAITLCDCNMFSYQDFLEENGREPFPQELPTYNWEELFNILIKNGLDPNLIICDDRKNHSNIFVSLGGLDDGDLNARIARNILEHGGNPNIIIDGVSFFERINFDLVFDMRSNLYQYKWQRDNAFRFWLVFVAFGGVIDDNECQVSMIDDNERYIFKDFEKFDYCFIREKSYFELQIYDKETKAVVATV